MLQLRCFPLNIAKFLRTPILKNICVRLLLRVLKATSFHMSLSVPPENIKTWELKIFSVVVLRDQWRFINVLKKTTEWFVWSLLWLVCSCLWLVCSCLYSSVTRLWLVCSFINDQTKCFLKDIFNNLGKTFIYSFSFFLSCFVLMSGFHQRSTCFF